MKDMGTLQDSAPVSLERAAWHRPLVSIIITHCNYSDFIHGAISSVLDQSHENWELVVVDDASSPEHREGLKRVLAKINDSRISAIYLENNVGQVPAFYAGFDKTAGDFVCLLDLDDRYALSFLEEAIAAHLNPVISCPIVSTEQYLMSENGLVSGCHTLDEEFRQIASRGNISPIGERSTAPYFIPATLKGWHWTSTSAMMFRRAALACLRPSKKPPFQRAFDSYAGHGAHMLGGSIFLPKPLVYRAIHERNCWHTDQFFSSLQKRNHARSAKIGDLPRQFAQEVLASNGIELPRPLTKLTTLQRWKRSIQKRLPKGNKSLRG